MKYWKYWLIKYTSQVKSITPKIIAQNCIHVQREGSFESRAGAKTSLRGREGSFESGCVMWWRTWTRWRTCDGGLATWFADLDSRSWQRRRAWAPPHTWAPTKWQPRGQKFVNQGGGLWKLLQGGGGKTIDRVWEGHGKKFFSFFIFFAKIG